MVDSRSPRWGEKASDDAAVCLQTGAVERTERAGTSSAAPSAAFLRQLRANPLGPLIIIWDNGPAHGGDARRADLATPDLRLRPVRLPADSPDDNADEAIWEWIREEVTANTCFGTKATVRDHVDAFFRDLRTRIEEVKTRCRTLLHADARARLATAATGVPTTATRSPQLGAFVRALKNRTQEVTTHGHPVLHRDDLALAGV